MFIQSPITYTGSKWRILRNVWKTAGCNFYDHFVDVFCGSLTVSINLSYKGKKIIANDIQKPLITLYKRMADPHTDFDSFIAEKNEMVKKYDGRTFFQMIKEEYNSDSYNNVLDLLLLAHCCYNGIMEFRDERVASSYGNKSFPRTGFTEQYLSLLRIFRDELVSEHKKFKFTDKDFRRIDYSKFGERDLIYFDPPYWVTGIGYNAGWKRETEKELYAILDELSLRKVNWILSNAISKGNKTNYVLEDWITKRNHGISYPNIEYNMSEDEIKEIMVFSNPNLFPNT